MYADVNAPVVHYTGANVGKSRPLTDEEIAKIGNIGEPTNSFSNGVDDTISNIVAKGRQTGKTEVTMFQMFLQTALAEVAEYNVLIKAAKTQAKRDYYQKKIKNVTKRLQRLLPA